MLLGTLEEEEEEENHLLQQQQLFVRDNDGNESSRILITVRVFYSKRRQAYYALLAFLRADSRRTVQDFSVATTRSCSFEFRGILALLKPNQRAL
jgi:hypothetical protein